MATTFPNSLCVPRFDDFHIHLRQGDMMTLVAGLLNGSGCGRVLVMPNTNPVIQTSKDALRYHNELAALCPGIEFLMTLYLGPWITVEDLQQNARACHVQGIKVYPKGVTTNSDEGIERLESYSHIFQCMEELGLSLHIHGEMPGANPMIAETQYLKTLGEIASNFPKLRIVLEHITTEEAIETVKAYSNVGATITAHHIDLTVADVLDSKSANELTLLKNDLKSNLIPTESESGDALDLSRETKRGSVSLDSPQTDFTVLQPHNFCKPLAKTNMDRQAIREVIQSGHPRFFLGSDSAPHPKTQKETRGNLHPPAGVFTSPLLLLYLADTFSKLGCIDRLVPFISQFGADFLKLPKKDPSLQQLVLASSKVPDEYTLGGLSVVPYRANEFLLYGFETLKAISA